MNTTYNFKSEKNNWNVQAVDCSQGLSFCVHIFDEAKDKIVVRI